MGLFELKLSITRQRNTAQKEKKQNKKVFLLLLNFRLKEKKREKQQLANEEETEKRGIIKNIVLLCLPTSNDPARQV